MTRSLLNGLCFLLLTLMMFTGCPKPGPDDPPDSLRAGGTAHNIHIGAAVNPVRFTETGYDTTLKTEFNMIVAENVMKMDTLQPTQGTFNYTPGDSIVAYALNNNMTVRGHALLWHSQLPAWIKTEPYADLKALLQNHIDNVLTHYKGKMHSWDVVNEVVKDDGSGLRNNNETADTPDYSIWADSLTDDSIIKEAFYRAEKDDPDAKLIINDYNNETMGNAKADKLYELIEDWVTNSSVPIHGVGFQLHLMEKYTPDYAKIRANIDRYVALGLDVQFTEIDVRIDDNELDSQALANQAAIYANFLQIALDYYPRVTVFVMWGVADKYSWIPSFFEGYGSALLFDDTYAPKPAYDALINMLR